MNNTHLLVGSLSNDLFRVASLTQRGSTTAALRFALEAKRWANSIQENEVAPYIHRIVLEISKEELKVITIEDAEKYLMYGVLLQNYALHTAES
ncbi:hypothetical protein KBD71_03920 [Candidatus Woesebacteria bacterium]|nr:hypothetical protein [Candidatus Woesebacteria bacterium]